MDVLHDDELFANQPSDAIGHLLEQLNTRQSSELWLSAATEQRLGLLKEGPYAILFYQASEADDGLISAGSSGIRLKSLRFNPPAGEPESYSAAYIVETDMATRCVQQFWVDPANVPDAISWKKG